MAPNDADRRTDYYAHSWALAHYLALRVTRDQLETYVNDVLAGKEPKVVLVVQVLALEAALGLGLMLVLVELVLKQLLQVR